MSLSVHTELACLPKPFSAAINAAKIWKLPSMDIRVLFEILVEGECLIAHLALVGLFVLVQVLVPFEGEC